MVTAVPQHKAIGTLDTSLDLLSQAIELMLQEIADLRAEIVSVSPPEEPAPPGAPAGARSRAQLGGMQADHAAARTKASAALAESQRAAQYFRAAQEAHGGRTLLGPGPRAT